MFRFDHLSRAIGTRNRLSVEATLYAHQGRRYHQRSVETAGGSSGGCEFGCGTVFSVSVGLGPFVETLPNSGKVGAAVRILGTDLTGVTSVTFNGAAAEFKVISKSQIETNIPSGATTGTVKVKLAKNTLKSNVVFE